MSYIKGGVVTRIENTNHKNNNKELETFFDLNLFNENGNDYLLKEKLLNENLKDFREEYLSLSNFKGDSLSNCEAYVLEKDVNKLLDNYIYLIDGNKRFFFKNHEEYIFETDYFMYTDEKNSFALYLIPIFWDINKVKTENFSNVINFVNNLTRKALNNKLKDACWFSVI